MCLSCGSYGVGEEGKLIACVQCGQCYHPYCVNIKVPAQNNSCFVIVLIALLYMFWELTAITCVLSYYVHLNNNLKALYVVSEIISVF